LGRADLAAIHRSRTPGFDHVFVHQVGPEVDGFLRFYQREIMPALRHGEAVATAAGRSG
jgi:hypothetical protein